MGQCPSSTHTHHTHITITTVTIIMWISCDCVYLYHVTYHLCSTVTRTGSLSMTFDLTSSTGGISFLEHVVITMTISIGGYSVGYRPVDFDLRLVTMTTSELLSWMSHAHPRRGDIMIQLTSPHGTTSTLLPYRKYDFVNEEGYSRWPFMSVHHWGENPSGQWTLSVFFNSSTGHVTVSDVSMTIFGTSVTPQAVSAIPANCSERCAGSCSAPGPMNCDVCKMLRVQTTLECVSECPPGTQPFKRYCIETSSSNEGTDPPSTLPSSPSGVTSTQPDERTSTQSVRLNHSSQGHVSMVIGSSVAAGILTLTIVLVLVIVGVVCFHRNHIRQTGKFKFVPLVPEPTLV